MLLLAFNKSLSLLCCFLNKFCYFSGAHLCPQSTLQEENKEFPQDFRSKLIKFPLLNRNTIELRTPLPLRLTRLRIGWRWRSPIVLPAPVLQVLPLRPGRPRCPLYRIRRPIRQLCPISRRWWWIIRSWRQRSISISVPSFSALTVSIPFPVIVSPRWRRRCLGVPLVLRVPE